MFNVCLCELKLNNILFNQLFLIFKNSKLKNSIFKCFVVVMIVALQTILSLISFSLFIFSTSFNCRFFVFIFNKNYLFVDSNSSLKIFYFLLLTISKIYIFKRLCLYTGWSYSMHKGDSKVPLSCSIIVS